MCNIYLLFPVFINRKVKGGENYKKANIANYFNYFNVFFNSITVIRRIF